ncbi:MAG: SDR family NAD(P)-dependent oxidoreductase [Bacteroidota bacterium]
MNFENKKVLITGGTRGIGAAIAAYLSGLGAEVWITGRTLEKSQRGFSVDFSSIESAAGFFEQLKSAPSFDVLVNNAGINYIESIHAYPDNTLDELLMVNYQMVLKTSKAVARQMIDAKIEGRIVNIASIWATHTKKGRSIYSSTKAALLGFTRGAAVDLAEYGILVNSVSPGFTETELTKKTMGKAGIEEVSEQIPLRRLAQPEEIAKVVGFLASNDNSYITGQNIIIDGGFTII